MFRRGKSSSLTLALAAGLLWLSPAWASGQAGTAAVPPVDVVRSPGAEQCPDAPAIATAVAARLGYTMDGAQPVRVRFSIARSRLVAEVVLLDAEGEPAGLRRLESPYGTGSCAELSSAVELAVALAVDPLAVGPTAGERPPGEPDSEEQQSVPEADELPAESPPPEPAHPVNATVPRADASTGQTSELVRVRVGLGAAVAIGSGPAMTGAATLHGALDVGRFAVNVGVRAQLPSSGRQRGGAGFTTHLVLFDLALCGRVIEALGVCALGAVGPFRSSGEGLDNAGTVLTPFAAAGGRLFAAIPLLSWMFLFARGDLLATLAHTSVLIDDEEIWSTPAVSVALSVGLEARL